MNTPKIACHACVDMTPHAARYDGTFVCDRCGTLATCPTCTAPVTLDHPFHVDPLDVGDLLGVFHDEGVQAVTLPGGPVVWPCALTAPHEAHKGVAEVSRASGERRGFVRAACPGARRLSLAAVARDVRVGVGMTIGHGRAVHRLPGVWVAPVGKVLATVWCEFDDAATAFEIAWLAMAGVRRGPYIVSPVTVAVENDRLVPTFTVQARAF